MRSAQNMKRRESHSGTAGALMQESLVTKGRDRKMCCRHFAIGTLQGTVDDLTETNGDGSGDHRNGGKSAS